MVLQEVLNSDLTGKLLVFWKTACLGEVVTTGGSILLGDLSITMHCIILLLQGEEDI